MYKSLLFTSFCLVLTLCAAANADVGQFGATPISPVNPNFDSSSSSPAPATPHQRQRDGAQPNFNEALNAAKQEIDEKTNTLLTAINQGRDPNITELAPFAETIKKNQQYLPRLDTKEQAKLQMLLAWLQYYEGQPRRARISANAAFKADPKNKDAETTYILMCIANNEIKSVKTAIATMKKKKPAAKPNQPVPSGNETPPVLDFDADSIKVELLDNNIGAFDAACLNGSTFSFKGGKTVMMLLWTNANVGTSSDTGGLSASMTQSTEPQSGQTLSASQIYVSLFKREFQNDKISFLGLNLDAAADSSAVMATLMKNAWPWPQAMAQDSRNAALAQFTPLHADKPSLVVVGSDGAIKYAGPLSSLALRVMSVAAQTPQTAQAGQTPQTPLTTPEPVKKTQEANVPPAAQPQAKDVNVPAATQQPVPTPKIKSDEEKLNPMATDLYQFAVSQKRMAYATGYGPMVNACKRILKEFPDAPEAEKARQLLREVPERKRAQYHITNEDLGL